jgi:hypothetical protein
MVAAPRSNYRYDGFGGTATCDYLSAMRDRAAGFRPDVVVLLFSGNALTPCMTSRIGSNRGILAEAEAFSTQRFLDAYRDDTVAAIDAFGPDTPIILVGVPVTRPDIVRPTTGLLDEVYRTIAAERANVYHLSLDLLLTPGGTFHAELPCTLMEPCTVGEPVPVRSHDGGHLCPKKPTFCFGGFRIAAMIHDAVHLLVAAESPTASAH